MKDIKRGIVILIILFVCWSHSCAQHVGILFRGPSSWDELVRTARAENKFIFVDVFASWCKPCKQMEQESYSDDSVGKFVNERFVSLKFQMDSVVVKDKDPVYRGEDVLQMCSKLRIASVPAFLFFSPDGIIVHEERGYHTRDEFINMALNAVDSGKQYFNLLKKFESQRLKYASMPELANLAFENDNKDVAFKVAHIYTDGFLLRNKVLLLQRDNLFFAAKFNKSSKDIIFSVFRKSAKLIDSIMPIERFSERHVDYVITLEEIDPVVLNDKKRMASDPEWGVLRGKIQHKYGQEIAERTVLDAQIRWYIEKGDSSKLTYLVVRKISRYGLDTAGIGKFLTNNMLYFLVFRHCNDKTVLDSAIGWMSVLVNADIAPGNPDFLDTYANLLYKAGRINEALAIEGTAMQLAPTESEIAENFAKMKKGYPTW